MKQSILRLLTIACLAAPLPAAAFSPYESFLLSGRPRQVGLLAELPPGRTEACAAALRALAGAEETERLAAAGIRNLAAFTRAIGGATWVVVHFTQDGGAPYLEAAGRFEAATGATARLAALVEPHPRAARFGTRWLQMEWINYIRGKDVGGPARSNLMLATTIRPDKEAEYRTLHQTVWPGVVDQVARSSNRDLCIFLAEIDGLLVEFLYLEYVGADQAADDAMSQSDAVNQRWWKLTDACQQGLPGVAGNWVLMDPLK